jgi:hypothetical protein
MSLHETEDNEGNEVFSNCTDTTLIIISVVSFCLFHT